MPQHSWKKVTFTEFYITKKICFLNTNHNYFIPLTVCNTEKKSEYNFVGKMYTCLECVSDQSNVQFCFTILFILISACHIKTSQPSYLSLSFPFFLSLIPIGFQLDISVNVPDILGTSQNALCPEMSYEQAALPAGPVTYEHQLDLLAVSLPSVINVPGHICLLLWCPL